MANVIKTVLTYPLDGSTRDFNIPFEYLARKFVVVTLIGVDRKVLTLNTDYRFATRTTISLTKAWGTADGYTTIELRRVTSTTDRLVDFTDGSILRAYDLNVAQIQTMHVAEEARDLTADTIGVNNDGHLDARGRRIVNLANAVDDRDAVPFGQLKAMNQNAWDAQNKAKQYRDEAEQFKNTSKEQAGISTTKRNESERFRNEALQFRNEAEQFKTQAGNSQTAARNSEVNAKTSETNAKTSETNALTHANSAKSEADRAKTEVDKLGNWNALAGTIDRVESTDVYFKGKVGSRSLTIHNDAKGADTKPVDQVWNQWRGQDSKETVWEQWIQAGPKRMDYYVFTNTDPSTWPDGRSNGHGRHDFYGGFHSHHDSRFYQNVSMDGYLRVSKYIRTDERFYTESTYGAGALANQLNNNAPYSQSLPGNQDGNVYYPMIKQYGRRSNGYPAAFSIGMVSKGDSNFHEGIIQLKGDRGSEHTLTITIQGQLSSNKGWLIASDGNLTGSVWGGKWIKQWIEENTVKQINMGSLQTSQLWRGKGVSDGGGKVVTGVVNFNSDDLPDGVQWRVMQYVRPNGSAYNIY